MRPPPLPAALAALDVAAGGEASAGVDIDELFQVGFRLSLPWRWQQTWHLRWHLLASIRQGKCAALSVSGSDTASPPNSTLLEHTGAAAAVWAATSNHRELCTTQPSFRYMDTRPLS